MVKNRQPMQRDTRNVDLIPGSRRLSRGGNDNPLAWRIPWIEKPGRLQSIGSQRVGYDLACTHAYIINKDLL